jgi:hypothetical protein
MRCSARAGRPWSSCRSTPWSIREPGRPRHRLDRYGAGRCLDYDQTGPEALAHAIAAEIGRPVSYRPVETDGAARAAALLSELI